MVYNSVIVESMMLREVNKDSILPSIFSTLSCNSSTSPWSKWCCRDDISDKNTDQRYNISKEGLKKYLTNVGVETCNYWK